MSSEELNLKQLLATQYPGLVVERNKLKAYIVSGVVLCPDGNWRRLRLYLPHYPALQDFQLFVQHNLEYKTFTSSNQPVQDNWLLEDLLAHLVHLVPTALPPQPLPHLPKTNPNIFAEILELHHPQAYHLQVNESFTRIRFSRFAEYEQHFLDLELTGGLRLLEHSLPDSVPLEQLLAKSARHLRDALKLFLKLLEELQPFYDNFMDIDELCHVLQPSPITTKDNTRVFPLRERVYLKLVITDPLACMSSLALQIIGPTEEVAQLRHLLSDGLGNWDTDLDMHKNLLRIFDLCYFPMALETKEEQEQEQHCNICYVYRLDTGDVPLVSCDNKLCVLKCHAACLEEWFKTLMDGKTFLDVSFGLCPFCKAKLSTSFAALLDK